MFKINDIVMVQSCKDLEPVKAKIIGIGTDEYEEIWYECMPIEFNSFSREFTADCLTLIQ